MFCDGCVLFLCLEKGQQQCTVLFSKRNNWVVDGEAAAARSPDLAAGRAQARAGRAEQGSGGHLKKG